LQHAMDFAHARETVLNLIEAEGRAKNSEISASIGGDRALQWGAAMPAVGRVLPLLMAPHSTGASIRPGGQSRGCHLLRQCIERDVVKASNTCKGDWKPMIFLMTDGSPTHSWEEEADRWRQMRPGDIIACAAGKGANEQALKRITDTVIRLVDTDVDTLKRFFGWCSSSVKVRIGD
jgi:hypothetical protein